MSRWVACLALLLLWSPLRSHAASGDPVDVKADRLQIDGATRTAVFEGHVRARFRDIAIRCGKMVVRYGDSGQLVSMEAFGPVRIERKGTVATAQRATLDVKQNMLVLSGEATLMHEGHQLQGTAVEVHLETGHVDVRDVRGTFVFQKGAP